MTNRFFILYNTEPSSWSIKSSLFVVIIKFRILPSAISFFLLYVSFISKSSGKNKISDIAVAPPAFSANFENKMLKPHLSTVVWYCKTALIIATGLGGKRRCQKHVNIPIKHSLVVRCLRISTQVFYHAVRL